MQYRFQWWPTVGVAGFLLLSAPLPGMSQSREMSSQGADSSYHSAMHQYGPTSQFDQNFSTNEFLTQAERDLIERVAVNVAIDPATARIGRNITFSAEQGVMILQGPVATEHARARLVNKVASIPGVVQVQDELWISDTAAADLSDRTARETRIAPEVRVAPIPPVGGAALAEERYLARSGGFPATQSKGAEAADDEALTGSGQMHKEDRTGTTGPSGSRTTSPMDTGAVDTVGRTTKSYGDYAVTTNDRALISQVRMALGGNPEFQDPDTLQLKADNGTVHMFGWVSSEREREAMEATVRDLSGVQGVVNHLHVRAATMGTVR